MDTVLLALLAGFMGGIVAAYLPRVRFQWKRIGFAFDNHKHEWNGSDGKHAGHVMQRCMVEGCTERRWKPSG